MKVFFDTNVLLDGYYQRPGAAASEEAIRLCNGGAHEGWIAWHTLSNAFYLVRGHAKSHAPARQFIRDLLAWADVAPVAKPDAVSAADSDFTDFEDALQSAAAEACGADVILTRNTSDFTTASIAVMTPEEFLAASEPT